MRTKGEPAASGHNGGLRRDALANQERVLAAAVTAVLREGRQVPMATIAEEAGVGIATLYRRYPTREALLAALTERSFTIVRSLAAEAAGRAEPAIRSIDWFLEGTIAHRDQLVLPLHGGPALTDGAKGIQDDVHVAIANLLERGRSDGTVRSDATTLDIIVFGAMVVQPLSPAPSWMTSIRRQKLIFLAGLAPVPTQLGEQP